MRPGLAAGLVEEGGDLILEAAAGRGSGVGGVAGGGSQAGGQFEGFAGFGKSHLVRVVGIHGFEAALGGIEERFGQGVLALAEGLGALGGIEELLALEVAFGLDVLAGEVSGASFDAAAPIEVTGPAADGAVADADLSGGGGEAAFRAELEVSAEGFEGAVGLALGLGEGEGRGLEVAGRRLQVFAAGDAGGRSGRLMVNWLAKRATRWAPRIWRPRRGLW